MNRNFPGWKEILNVYIQENIEVFDWAHTELKVNKETVTQRNRNGRQRKQALLFIQVCVLYIFRQLYLRNDLNAISQRALVHIRESQKQHSETAVADYYSNQEEQQNTDILRYTHKHKHKT